MTEKPNRTGRKRIYKVVKYNINNDIKNTGKAALILSLTTLFTSLGLFNPLWAFILAGALALTIWITLGIAVL